MIAFESVTQFLVVSGFMLTMVGIGALIGWFWLGPKLGNPDDYGKEEG